MAVVSVSVAVLVPVGVMEMVEFASGSTSLTPVGPGEFRPTGGVNATGGASTPCAEVEARMAATIRITEYAFILKRTVRVWLVG